MNTASRPKMVKSLSFRLLFIILIVSICIFTVFTYLSIKLQRDSLMSAMVANTQRISDVITKSTRHGMLLNRKEDVYQIMKTIGESPTVERIRLINKKGEITFSSDPQEINTRVDMKAEACYVCHNDDGGLKQTVKNERTRIVISPDGYRAFGAIEPIKNERDCNTADCHAHPADKTILGVLDVKLKLDQLDEAITYSQNNLIYISLVLIIFIIILFIFSIRFYVHKPIKKLYLGTVELASGNLDYKIELNSKDEFGVLANSFNVMTRDLKKARDEITDWSETLEKKVDDKTLELKKMQTQIIKIEKMASLGKLSATVAHELNNPLAGMLNYAKLIMRRLSNKEMKEDAIEKSLIDLKIISDEIQRLGNIVKNLLLFSKKREGDFVHDKLTVIIISAIDLLRHHFQVNNVKLETKFEECDDTFYCDPHQIKQALIAIMINSAEAMAGGGTLEIATSYSTENDFFEISISDTGIGIDKDDLPNIFEPFFTTKVDGKGVGLGLAVVYGIIERHNGSIEVNSEKNKGTTMVIKLPRNINQNLK